MPVDEELLKKKKDILFLAISTCAGTFSESNTLLQTLSLGQEVIKFQHNGEPIENAVGV